MFVTGLKQDLHEVILHCTETKKKTYRRIAVNISTNYLHIQVSGYGDYEVIAKSYLTKLMIQNFFNRTMIQSPDKFTR